MDELTLDTEHIVPQQQGNRIRIQAIILRGNGMVIRYTIGNIVGGAIFVGAIYMLAYLRGKPKCEL